MSSEALLAVLGLCVAFYTVLPVDRRLNLWLKIDILDILLILIALFAIHYIKYYPVLYSLGIAPYLGPWKWGFDPSSTSYLIILGTSIIVLIRLQTAGLTKKKLPLLRSLEERLISDRKYSDIFYLLDKHMDKLFQFYIKDGSKEASEAGYILRRLMLAKDVVSEMAKMRPELGLKLLNYNIWERDEFLAQFTYTLLEDTSSSLYFELRNNETMRSGNRYKIHNENQFISFFLKDLKNWDKFSVYKPFGDFTLGKLKELTKLTPDTYNQPFDHQKKQVSSCPIFAVIRFFDIMVMEALYQNITWHMWLYYFPHFAESVLKNINPAPEVDLDTEWPTQYHFLLYSILGTIRGWIEEVLLITEDQKNIVLDNKSLSNQNDNIPKSAIIAMGDCYFHIICSKKIDHKFKGYLLEMALRLIIDLHNKGKKDFAEILHLSINEGGHISYNNHGDYKTQLTEVMSQIDQIEATDIYDIGYFKDIIDLNKL